MSIALLILTRSQEAEQILKIIKTLHKAHISRQLQLSENTMTISLNSMKTILLSFSLQWLIAFENIVITASQDTNIQNKI